MNNTVELLVEKILGTDNEPITEVEIDLAIIQTSKWLQELTEFKEEFAR